MLDRRTVTLLAQRLARIAATPLATGQALDRAMVCANCADDYGLRAQQQQINRRQRAFIGAEVQEQCGWLGRARGVDARADIQRQRTQGAPLVASGWDIAKIDLWVHGSST